jgi:crotonobetainyl-CoA:carnitine CoA-transferase CaiB-like acyl-CoA transferase
VAAPLDGVRILDLSNYLAGPVAVKILMQLGAKAIKVEPPTGDPSRRGSGTASGAAHNGTALTLHRNKRSIAIDLKKPGGVDVLMDLVKRSDVFVENYRPGLARTLGVAYPDVAKANPRIVYCSISAYGSTGPMAAVSSTDGPVQAFGGIGSLFPTATGPGLTSPVLLADVPGGLFAAHAILAALYGRDRSGVGAAIDMSLYEPLLQMIPYQIQDVLLGAPSISRSSTGVQMPMLEAGDAKWVYVQLPFVPIADRFNGLVAELSGLRDPLEDPRFATAKARADNAPEYIALVQRAFARRPQADWLRALWDAGIPAAPANTLAESLRSEQLAARSGLSRVASGDREVEVVGNPFRYTAGYDVPRDEVSPPWIGEDSVEILRQAGYPSERIAELERLGVIASHAIAPGV